MLDEIENAMRNLHLLEIVYQDKKGNITRRVIEPYSFRHKKGVGEVLYGFCHLRGDIRCFALNKILRAKETNNSFVPRWEVEID